MLKHWLRHPIKTFRLTRGKYELRVDVDKSLPAQPRSAEDYAKLVALLKKS